MVHLCTHILYYIYGNLVYITWNPSMEGTAETKLAILYREFRGRFQHSSVVRTADSVVIREVSHNEIMQEIVIYSST